MRKSRPGGLRFPGVGHERGGKSGNRISGIRRWLAAARHRSPDPSPSWKGNRHPCPIKPGVSQCPQPGTDKFLRLRCVAFCGRSAACLGVPSVMACARSRLKLVGPARWRIGDEAYRPIRIRCSRKARAGCTRCGLIFLSVAAQPRFHSMPGACVPSSDRPVIMLRPLRAWMRAMRAIVCSSLPRRAGMSPKESRDVCLEVRAAS